METFNSFFQLERIEVCGDSDSVPSKKRSTFCHSSDQKLFFIKISSSIMSFKYFKFQMLPSEAIFKPVTIDMTSPANEISYEDIHNLSRYLPIGNHVLLTHLHNIVPYVRQLGLRVDKEGHPVAKTVALNIKFNNDIIPVKYFSSLKIVEYQNPADCERSFALPLYRSISGATFPSERRPLPAPTEPIPLSILIMGLLHGGNIMAQEDTLVGCKGQPFSWLQVRNLVGNIDPDEHPTKTAEAMEDLNQLGLLSHNHSTIQTEPHQNFSSLCLENNLPAHTLMFPSPMYKAALCAHAQEYLVNFVSSATVNATKQTRTRTEDEIECDNQDIVRRFETTSSKPLDDLSKEFARRVGGGSPIE